MLSRLSFARSLRQTLRKSQARLYSDKIPRLSDSDITVIDEVNDASSQLPLIPTKRQVTEPLFEVRKDLWCSYPPMKPSPAREAWIEDLTTVGDDNSNQIVKLHPDVWAVTPRLDIIQKNVNWQLFYKRVDYDYQKDRYEMSYSRRRRPWPQKGMGRARHATTTSPIWFYGGAAHGNKGPRSYFRMLPYLERVDGLIHALSAKFAQDDVRIVKDLDIPSDDPKYIEDLIDSRR